METLRNSLPLAPIQTGSRISGRYNSADPEQVLCDAMNANSGILTGYDCPICKNKGVNYRISPDTGSIVAAPCKCKAIRQARRTVQQSGLGDMLERCTLDTYRADHPWQQKALQTAKAFLAEPEGNWLYVGGQVGAGKTHLCAAVTGELLRRGFRSQYSMWRVEAQSLRTHVNDDAYRSHIAELSRVPVLYIDDFLKVENGEYQRPRNEGHAAPTGAEIRIAIDLVNARYNLRSTITIFSSEHLLKEVNVFDSALASRIAERCQKDRFLIGIRRSDDRNMRYAL